VRCASRQRFDRLFIRLLSSESAWRIGVGRFYQAFESQDTVYQDDSLLRDRIGQTSTFTSGQLQELGISPGKESFPQR